MEDCKHCMEIPTLTKPVHLNTHCGLYSKHTIKGKHWAHYPKCNVDNCPLVHPELLGDAVRVKE